MLHPSYHSKWILPPTGCHKLNFDGCCILQPKAIGSNGVIRDSNSNTDFFSFDGHGDATEAELMGVLHGLNTAWNHSLKQLICVLDNEPITRIL